MYGTDLNNIRGNQPVSDPRILRHEMTDGDNKPRYRGDE
jgi:hypothetical protein